MDVRAKATVQASMAGKRAVRQRAHRTLSIVMSVNDHCEPGE